MAVMEPVASDQAPSEPSAPLRALALFEAAKGFLVILVGAGILKWTQDVQRVAAALVAHLHLNPAKHHALIFTLIEGGASSHLWWLALGAALYSGGRLAESVGLWLGKRWAIWLAISTAVIYVPFEIEELVRRPGALAAGALCVNALVILYLFWRHVHLFRPPPQTGEA